MAIPMRPNAMNAMAAGYRTPTNAPPPAAHPGDDFGPTRWAQGGSALMQPPQQPAASGRVDPTLLSDLPPEFVEALMELGQLIDLDQDGTPDIAVVPLHGNAMANAMMPPPGSRPR